MNAKIVSLEDWRATRDDDASLARWAGRLLDLLPGQVAPNGIPRDEMRRIAHDRKLQRDRERQSAIRAEQGRQTRTSYEANSLSTLKPWEAEGVSRATWYRRRRSSGNGGAA